MCIVYTKYMYNVDMYYIYIVYNTINIDIFA